jgi:acetylornithine/N-succinyldiaminopimelate aminotransferase
VVACRFRRCSAKKRLPSKGNYLRDRLLKLSDKHGLEGERGEGLLRVLKLGKSIGGKIVEIARDLEPQGLLLNSPRPDLLCFMSALNVTTEEIDLMLELLSGVIGKAGYRKCNSTCVYRITLSQSL